MKKISLCLIVGNVEEYISRCLSSFQALADEICIVRAIGNQKPDRTVQIAVADFGARAAEYRNALLHRHWPHVDDFAAARQMSFEMAEGEYCFWCDTDDVLESGAELIREHAERGGYPSFIFPYKIFGRGVLVPRERMILRGAGRWVSPVHEYFRFTLPVEGIQDDRVVVTHLPHLNKSGSNQRNLRILESIPRRHRTPGILYHLHGEYVAAGKKLRAVQIARQALADPALGKPERYELFLNLARISKGPREKRAFLLQAYGADPCRREALGLLTCTALDCGDAPEALAYARQMMATLRPAGESWNDRPAAYEWLGVEIYQQALRAAGQFEEAEKLRVEMLKRAGGARIALVHATRGRPVEASHARKMWLDLAEKPEAVEHIFVTDNDDASSLCLQRMHCLIMPAGGGCVAAWNAGARATTAPVIIQMSDDWVPVPQWDRLILERLGDVTKPAVLAISDGSRRDGLLCMAILTRARLKQQGGNLFHPSFLSMYSDNWFTECAQRDGVIIEGRDLVFEHAHPAFGKGKLDDIYSASNAQWRYSHGAGVLQRLRSGVKTWKDVEGWCDFAEFYDHVAERLQDGDIFAEVGVWKGQSLIYLAQRLQDMGKHGVRIFAVDSFAGDEGTGRVKNLAREFLQNIRAAGVDQMITVRFMESPRAATLFWDGALAGVFIDASHDYESVKADLAAWLPKVRLGGIFAGHDYGSPGVQRAVDENKSFIAYSVPPSVWLKA